MGNNGGSSGWRILVVIILVVMVCVGGFLLWKWAVANGYLQGSEELARQVTELTAQNQELQTNLSRAEAENAQLKTGIPSWVFLALLVAAIVLAFVASTTAGGNIGGRNVTRAQAQEIARRVIEDEHGWKSWIDAPGWYPVWREMQTTTGQVVDGDADALWYIIHFAQDAAYGGGIAPRSQCITVMIKSNDAERQINVEKGMNVHDAWEAHKVKLQRSPQPTSLVKELKESATQMELNRAIRTIGEEV